MTNEVFKVGELRELTAAEIRTHWDKVVKAMQKELESWASHDACIPRMRSEALGRAMSSRWVFTFKEFFDEKGVKFLDVKARLVLRGFMDPQLNQLWTSASTATALSHRMLCSKAVRMKWRVLSWDISTAFLQGLTFALSNQERRTGTPERRVFFDLPTTPTDTYEMLYSLDPKKYKLMETTFLDNIVMEALKAIYGLADAPALWREVLKRCFIELIGCHVSNYDESMFYRRSPATKRIVLMLTMHVDDVEATGTPSELARAKRIIVEKFGTVREQVKDFLHCGKRYRQPSLQKITMDQERFALQIPYVELGKIPKSRDAEPCDSKMHTCYRAGVGALIWLLQTRPDLAAPVSILQSFAAAPTIANVRQLNKTIKEAKDHAHLCLTYASFDDDADLVVKVFPDASFNTREGSSGKKRTQIGWVVVLTLDNDRQDNPCHLLNWPSKKATRVCKATLGAEAIGQTAGFEDALKISGWLHEIDTPGPHTAHTLLTKQLRGGFCYSIEAYTDAYSLYQVLVSPSHPNPSDASCLLWLVWLREQLTNQAVRSAGWCSTGDMYGDGLTKVLPSQERLHELMRGEMTMRYASLRSGETIEPWKGLPPPKKENHECTANWVMACWRLLRESAQVGHFAWWECPHG